MRPYPAVGSWFTGSNCVHCHFGAFRLLLSAALSKRSSFRPFWLSGKDYINGGEKR